MGDDGIELDFWFNWAAVPLFLVPALLIGLYGRHVSGGWARPWISLKPVWWFLLLFLVPPLGYLLLVVNLFVYRKVPGAVAGSPNPR